jgi:hypothetical protein
MPDHPPTLTRRSLGRLALGATAAAVPLAAPFVRPAPAAAATLRWLSDTSQNRYYTYPHKNGFWDGGRRLVLGQRDATGTVTLVDRELAGSGERHVGTLPLVRGATQLWYDVAEPTGTLTVAAGDQVWMCDLTASSPSLVSIYRPPTGYRLNNMACIHPQGMGAYTSYLSATATDVYATTHSMVNIRFSTREVTPRVTQPWYVNHYHVAPGDPTLIAYAKQLASEPPDRIWAYRGSRTPPTWNVWDQRGLDGQPVLVTHERWTFHDSSFLVVAFGGASTTRGLLQVTSAGVARLVRGSSTYWHCNISRDGRRAVVDTTPSGGTSSLVVIDMATGAATTVLTGIGTASHPGHPHPHVTPDGTGVVFTAAESGGATRVGLLTL